MTDQELKNLIADNFRAIRELRTSQQQTDEQIKELRASQQQTDEQLKDTDRLIKELRASQQQTGEQQKQTDEQQKQTDEQTEELRTWSREFSEKLKQTEKLVDRNSVQIASLRRQFGDFGNNRGKAVENFFFRYFESEPRLGGIAFDEVRRNVNVPDDGEHDIVLINDTVSALISVKYKLYRKDVDRLLEEETERFRRYLRKLGSTHSFYVGVASFILNREVEEYAVEKGLWVVVRSGKNSAVLNAPSFEARRFD